MRTSNIIEIISDQITGATPVVSAQEHNEPLGRADQNNFHIRATGVSGAGVTLLVEYQGSNDNKYFMTQATLVNAVSINSNSVYEVFASTGTTSLGAYGRLVVTLGGTTPAATVRISSCSRAS